MFGNYFYNKNIRNMVSTFGTVFNNIKIRRTRSNGQVEKEIKVPLAYGPKEKYLVRLNQDITKKVGTKNVAVEITLPRMSFEFNSISYDPTRKLQTTHKLYDATSRRKIDGTGERGLSKILLENSALFQGFERSGILFEDSTRSKLNYSVQDEGRSGGDGGLNPDRLFSIFNPVPFNFDISLNIMVQYSEDGTQILEQILPYFTPEFNVVLKEVPDMAISRDIPIIFNGLLTEDTYEGDFTNRRAIIHTLSFLMKGFIYGQKTASNLIKTVNINTFDINNTDTSTFDHNKIGTIDNITLATSGKDYETAPIVTISAPPTGGTTATGRALLGGGSITSITITTPGQNYQVGDDIIIKRNNSDSSNGIAEITAVDVNGGITEITISNSGSNFIEEPDLEITAEDFFVIQENGDITELEDGSGRIEMQTSNGTGAVLQSSGFGKVVFIELTNAGSGYVSNPTVTLSSGGGAGATATASIFKEPFTGSNVEQTIKVIPSTADATDDFGFSETTKEFG